MSNQHQDIQVAVVTGGHGYDVKNFHDLFHSLPGVNPYIQHMDDFANSAETVRDSYDVVLFYTMLMQTPVDEGLAWYAGKPKSALEHLGTTSQGIFMLHHSLLAFPQWSHWNELVGIDERSFGFYGGESIQARPTNPAHPIVKGLADWEMVDETYTMKDAGAGNEIVLTVEHPKSMKTLAWTRQVQSARVFCFQSGHDNITWANPGFQWILQHGIEWCAGRD
jgi:hypothetical protein